MRKCPRNRAVLGKNGLNLILKHINTQKSILFGRIGAISGKNYLGLSMRVMRIQSTPLQDRHLWDQHYNDVRLKKSQIKGISKGRDQL